MSDTTTIVAQPRSAIGKASRRLAAAGQIPAVLYGAGREPLALAVDRHEFEMFVTHHAAGATLVTLQVEGEGKAVNAMIKEVQHSPVKGTILHIDFLAVRMDEKVAAQVALHLVGDSPGVKAGGILMQGVYSANIEALPLDLPEAIEVDVSGLELGETLTIAAVAVPAGVTILDDPETAVCSVALPRAEEEVAEEVAEEVEPEVIGAAEESSEE